MKYIIHCLLKGDVEGYQHGLVNEISKQFDLQLTKKENLDTHFTLKYWFETDNIAEVELLVQKFCDEHNKTPVKLGGFNGFKPKVIFIDVNLSEEARNTFCDFVNEIRKISWMPWDKYDAENLHFHSTIAEECDEQYDLVLNYIRGKEKYFECYFDNVTILKLVDESQYYGKWEIYKSFRMK